MDSEYLSIHRMTKGKLPRLPFAEIKEKVLGKRYDLSIVFATPTFAQQANRQYRNKDYIPNVLSFPLSDTSGEIILSLSVVRRNAKEYGLPYHDCIAYLLIHGMLHLKGMEHGSTMEAMETKWLRHFGFVLPAHQ